MLDPHISSLVHLLHHLHAKIRRQIVFSNDGYGFIADVHDRVHKFLFGAVMIRAHLERLSYGISYLTY